MIDRFDRWMRKSRWNPLLAVVVLAVLVLVVTLGRARYEQAGVLISPAAKGANKP